MTALVYTIHIIVCLALVIIVLLQAGKGADMGASFGGSSKTVFGPRGAAGPLAKITVGAAVLFMLTNLYLTWDARRNKGNLVKTPAAVSAPVTPQSEPPTGSGPRTISIPVGNEGGQPAPGGAPITIPVTPPAPGGSPITIPITPPAPGSAPAPAPTPAPGPAHP